MEFARISTKGEMYIKSNDCSSFSAFYVQSVQFKQMYGTLVMYIFTEGCSCNLQFLFITAVKRSTSLDFSSLQKKISHAIYFVSRKKHFVKFMNLLQELIKPLIDFKYEVKCILLAAKGPALTLCFISCVMSVPRLSRPV